MSSLLDLQPKSGKVAPVRVPTFGISEWMCYYVNYDVPGGDRPEAIDECIDKHIEHGIRHIVWNCGRSTVDYWSDLPHTTQQCEDGAMVGGKDWSFVATVMGKVCPLCRAIELCRAKGVTVLGRLGMNRHYGGPKASAVTSRFAREHPDYYERSKPGNPVPHKLCYAIPEVRQERLDILLEIQRIGVDALVLDFCRQMPMLLYHDALVKPFMEKSGKDPRAADPSNPDDCKDWFQWRADVLTGFMRDLRREVRRQEERLGRPCPIVARVPDSAPWLMVAFGLDVERWCKEDLVDGTMLSPFPLCHEDMKRYPEYHVKTAHRYGKFCIGGIGSLKLIRNGMLKNTGFYHPHPVYVLAQEQYKAGVDAMSLYQSESLVRMDYLKPLLTEVGDKAAVARGVEEMLDPGTPADYPIGMDWHSKARHSLRVEIAGDDAL